MYTTTATSSIALFKNSTYLATILFTIDYLGLTPISVGVLATLIIADIVTGIIRSGVINGWRSIKSSVAERGVLAKLFLVLVPATLALAGKGVGMSLEILAQSTINVMILAEAYSIIGNIYSLKTGQEKKEFDAINFILEKIKDVLKKIIIDDKT